MEYWPKASTANSYSTGNFAHNVKREVGDLMMVVGNGNYLVKPVMTDEQVEVLRQQIAMFATICEQLVEMHRSISAHQDAIAGTSLGNLYCDPLMINGNSHKITPTPRQRWTPTQLQLQILENIFQLGNGTPCKQRIKEITSELQAHGQISETNVYNWFQNRRARSKRKKATTIETETEGSKVAKGKSEKIGLFQSAEGSSEACESVVLNPKVNQLMGEEEIPHGFQHGNIYNLTW